MVYLASLATAAGFVADNAVNRWSVGLADTLTIEIMPDPDSVTATDERQRSVLELLSNTNGVLSAAPLSNEEMGRLLEPWLGIEGLAASLPIPRLINVQLEPKSMIDVPALAAEITTLVPSARLDDHTNWQERIAALGQAVTAVMALIVDLVTISAAVTVVFTTRAGVAIHHDVIELLHQIGARDSYIARQFQSHARNLALKGGIIGGGLGLATLLVIEQVAVSPPSAFLPVLDVTSIAWITVATLPFAAALVATLTARITVARALRQML